MGDNDSENDANSGFWDHAFKALEHVLESGKQREQEAEAERDARRRTKQVAKRTQAKPRSTEFAGDDCCVVGRKKLKL